MRGSGYNADLRIDEVSQDDDSDSKTFQQVHAESCKNSTSNHKKYFKNDSKSNPAKQLFAKTSRNKDLAFSSIQ